MPKNAGVLHVWIGRIANLPFARSASAPSLRVRIQAQDGRGRPTYGTKQKVDLLGGTSLQPFVDTPVVWKHMDDADTAIHVEICDRSHHDDVLLEFWLPLSQMPSDPRCDGTVGSDESASSDNKKDKAIAKRFRKWYSVQPRVSTTGADGQSPTFVELGCCVSPSLDKELVCRRVGFDRSTGDVQAPAVVDSLPRHLAELPFETRKDIKARSKSRRRSWGGGRSSSSSFLPVIDAPSTPPSYAGNNLYVPQQVLQPSSPRQAGPPPPPFAGSSSTAARFGQVAPRASEPQPTGQVSVSAAHEKSDRRSTPRATDSSETANIAFGFGDEKPAHAPCAPYDSLVAPGSRDLPPGWERRALPTGVHIFIDHIHRTTTTESPLLVQSNSAADLLAPLGDDAF